ncbi:MULTISPECIES: MFS transporter [unclassified Beijerinckia]|uniref:MFS transporter n=1 Tax=unclassified Beijerinckia TaxID=2638183 RepID=UPI0008976694|nr:MULTISPECIES: MFS transporter [unclassified Beijerinckia]MDH7798358.1 MFS family permease [Beijerinckia sp. GAS462]SED18257.1 Predicted arabinose efflux permease, MFS family [Beijerinckia sp. 28-YEA-48]
MAQDEGRAGAPVGIKLGVVSAIMAASLTTSITVPPILPKMLDHYRDVPNATFLVPLVVTLPFVVSVIIAPFVGALSDRIDRRAIVIAASLFATLFGCAPYFLEALPAILIARFLMGLATGTLLVCTSALIADLFVGPGRQRMLGLKYAALGITHIAAFAVIGHLAETDWHNAFLIFLWGLVAAALTLAFIPRRPNVERGTAVAHAAPIPWRRLAPVFGGVLLGAMAFDVLLTGTPFLAIERGLGGARMAGYLAAVASTGMLIGASLFPFIARRIEGAALWIIIFAIAAAGYLLLAAAPSLPFMVAGILIVGAGCGMVQPNSLSILFGLVPVTARGRVAGIQTTCFFLGMAVGPLIGVTLGKALGSHAILFDGFGLVLVAIAAIYLLLLWRERRSGPTPGEATSSKPATSISSIH